MRISDWSSDVCSSDLAGGRVPQGPDRHRAALADQRAVLLQRLQPRDLLADFPRRPDLEEGAGRAARSGRRDGAAQRAEIPRLTPVTASHSTGFDRKSVV